MMRLYFCHRKGEKRGLYIIAPTEKRARHKYAFAARTSFHDITADGVDIDVDPDERECIVYPNSMTAQMYGIEYTDEERGRRG